MLTKPLLNDGACHENADALRAATNSEDDEMRNHNIMIYEVEKLSINGEKALQPKEDIELEFLDLALPFMHLSENMHLSEKIPRHKFWKEILHCGRLGRSTHTSSLHHDICHL